jgi:B-box zinc finger protein
MTDVSKTYCANHPTVETSLRCNNCGKYICARCAIRTPTGYRCKDCVRSHQRIFDTAQWSDYLFGALIAAFVSGVASFLISLIGNIGFFGWILVAAGAPTAGAIVAEAVRMVTGRRRSRTLFITIFIAMIVGALPVALFQLVSFNFFGLIFQGIYLFVSVPTAYYRLSGIQLFK